MSDMQPRQGMSTEAAVEANRSIFNPADMAVMQQRGQLPDINNVSVRDFLGQFGVDVDGPATQLVEMAKSQLQKADPVNKMKAVAGSQPRQNPVQGQQPQPTPGGGGLRELMGG